MSVLCCLFLDIRPYKCQYCDYYARTNSQLKVHMMRHQGTYQVNGQRNRRYLMKINRASSWQNQQIDLCAQRRLGSACVSSCRQRRFWSDWAHSHFVGFVMRRLVWFYEEIWKIIPKWAASWQNQQSDCAPSEDSGKPGHPPSLIKSLRCLLKG